MKKTVLILLTLIASEFCFPYTWVNFGPIGIKANKLCLLDVPELNYAVICVDSGMYFTSNIWMPVWEYYEFPVTSAAALNENNILVIAGNGSYSDGIYNFNLQTHEFEIIEYCMNPNFIIRGGSNYRYFVGHENGLLESIDGITWTTIPVFDGNSCMDMSSYFDFEYLALATNELTNNVYYSEDNGENWIQIEGNFKISEVLLGWNGWLAGICSENTSFCGFYKKIGTQWNNEFYSDKINTLGSDNTGTPFIGWYDAIFEHKGIARYKFNNPNAGLMFLNEGLPNLNINDISTSFDYFGGNIVFCCTDGGVFYSNDYAVGVNLLTFDNTDVTLFPNPISKTENFQINVPENYNPKHIKIYSQTGILVNQIDINNKQQEFIIINAHDLIKGIYYIEIIGEKETWTKKLIRH
ncbi:MAG: T9SS type A sorting domain-containing protein [Bacteroidales bacterium]|jgi:hypothetical protein|nr:T9SS type A sorting domain-containing protein [Bacteroidales bacterium]